MSSFLHLCVFLAHVTQRQRTITPLSSQQLCPFCHVRASFSSNHCLFQSSLQSFLKTFLGFNSKIFSFKLSFSPFLFFSFRNLSLFASLAWIAPHEAHQTDQSDGGLRMDGDVQRVSQRLQRELQRELRLKACPEIFSVMCRVAATRPAQSANLRAP